MENHGEHNPGDHEDPLPGPTWIIGILGAVLLSICVLGITALFFNADSRMVEVKVVDANYPQVEMLKAEQLRAIEGPARRKQVIENEQVVETVVIPIDQAMEKYAQRIAQKQATQPQ